MQLSEKHRPREWAQVIGQSKAIATIDRLRKAGGLSGRAYWVSGKSGTGKTTIGLLLAQEIADPLNIEEIDAQELTPARIRDMERLPPKHEARRNPALTIERSEYVEIDMPPLGRVGNRARVLFLGEQPQTAETAALNGAPSTSHYQG
jgi:DNA helicase TIP49 (TBP-interacting protein)